MAWEIVIEHPIYQGMEECIDKVYDLHCELKDMLGTLEITEQKSSPLMRGGIIKTPNNAVQYMYKNQKIDLEYMNCITKSKEKITTTDDEICVIIEKTIRENGLLYEKKTIEDSMDNQSNDPQNYQENQ